MSSPSGTLRSPWIALAGLSSSLYAPALCSVDWSIAMPIEVTLRLPTELGASVVSRSAVRERLADGDLAIRSESRSVEDIGALHDFGATLLAIAGTAAASAAVKGLFDVLKTVISEAHATRRARFAEDAKYRRLELLLDERSELIDLDANLDEILARLGALERELEGELSKA